MDLVCLLGLMGLLTSSLLHTHLHEIGAYIYRQPAYVCQEVSGGYTPAIMVYNTPTSNSSQESLAFIDQAAMPL